MTSCRLYSALLNLLTGWVFLTSVWPLALLPASLCPGGVSSPWLSCCSKREMVTGLPKAYGKEPEKSLVALG